MESKKDAVSIEELHEYTKDLQKQLSKMQDEINMFKSKKHKRIVLVGKAASGKDYARKKLQDRGFTYGISYTTRPPRTGEVDGVDYHFISKEKFEEMIANNEFYEWVPFNGWYYGTSLEQFYRDDIFIMTPKGIAHIPAEDRKRTLIMYFDIPYEIRKERLALRSDADAVDRRLAADEADFADFKDYDIRIDNPSY